MRVKCFIAVMLLTVASIQTIWAQKVVVNKADGTYISYDVSELNSIEFFEAGGWLVRKIVLSETSITLKPDETKTLTTTVLPEDADNKTVTWGSSNEEVAEVNKNGRVIANAGGTCIITCTAADGSGVRATCEVKVMHEGTYGTTNGHDWVDLGLPSGTKWATCNVGASKPEEYGGYYAWGETSVKSDYSRVSSYKYSEVSFYKMTKYCTLDNKTELESIDDAATVNWGDGWKTPSIEQIGELHFYTIAERTTLNGVYGCMMTSKMNGNSIFFPAAGYREGTNLNDKGNRGKYWSCSLYPYNSYDRAYILLFDFNDVYSSSIAERFLGLSVRPVRKQ